MATERFGVVGGGIVGLAVARRLLQLRPGAAVVVLEKEDTVARHQTGHNSGVAHAGLSYVPGSLKAVLCRRGVVLLEEFCARHAIAYDVCGKIVVARDPGELDRLRAMFDRATANGVPGVAMVGPDGIRELEPHAVGVAGLHSPTTAIVDFAGVARALVAEVEAGGGEVRVGHAVTALDDGAEVTVTAGGERHRFDQVVVCAGLHSHRVAQLVGDDADPRIIPFRGEYHRLVPERTHLVRGLIYPVPDPRYPFLGVHFTRRVDGHVDLGPNAVLALALEGYRRRDIRARDVADIVGWPGAWRMARRHWRTGLGEVHSSFSTKAFVRRAQAYVPEVTAADVRPAPAGVRAQAVDRQGGLVEDFVVRRHGAVALLRNAPSPAATSSLAIAEHLCEQLLGGG